MDSLGINSKVVLTCVENQGAELVAEHSSAASSVGVTGSPSLVINGVIVSASRTAEAYKTAVCSAFNDAPEECGETLSSSATTTSGNC
jgi:protein-disulfide isomerase